MIDTKITRELITSGRLKKGHVVVIGSDNSLRCFTCKITKIIHSGDDMILKLRTGKDYPLGHKYVFRSISELI